MPMPTTFPTYTVDDRLGETWCDECGLPLEVGDTIYTDDLDAVSFTACSVRCAAAHY